jgi:hypothetical protein
MKQTVLPSASQKTNENYLADEKIPVSCSGRQMIAGRCRNYWPAPKNTETTWPWPWLWSCGYHTTTGRGSGAVHGRDFTRVIDVEEEDNGHGYRWMSQTFGSAGSEFNVAFF